MKRIKTLLLAALLLGIGYWLGATRESGLRTASAQEADDALSQEQETRIQEAYRRLLDARDALQTAGRYEVITEGINSYLILSGGGNAREDLERGRGVDPETFAALYAGKALPEIQILLERDEQGRITYNNEVVRMYSQARLEQMYARRLKLTEFDR